MFSPDIYFIHDSIYMSILLSPLVPFSPSLTVSSSPFSIFPADRVCPHHVACGILVPWPGIECPLHWKHRLLTTGPPGKSQRLLSHLRKERLILVEGGGSGRFQTCVNEVQVGSHDNIWRRVRRWKERHSKTMGEQHRKLESLNYSKELRWVT